ncbi:basic proline-rich protein [Gracilaria domingensis]|nr:basic proline-rich protein [Gracilaria domingensis]
MPRGRSARATRNSRLPQIVEMDGTLLEAYNHMDDLPRLSAEPKKRPRHVTRGSIAAERKAAAVAAATLTTFAATPSPRVTRRNRAAATAAAAAIAAAADPKRKQERLAEQHPKLSCRVCLRSNSSLKIIRCAVCRKGVHTFCLNPPVMDLPAFGSWKCYKCKRKAVALKKEKRTILRDALVSYPTLCTNSFVEKIIHTAAAVDAAAVAPKLISPLTTNHVNASQPETDLLPNGRTRTHAAAEATDPHSHDLSNPSDSQQHAQAVQAAIPFTRARHSTDQLSALPAPVTDTTVVVRVPKELHLDQINPCTPKLPQQSLAVSRSSPRPPQAERPFEPNKSRILPPQDHAAPRPISIHQAGIAKPPTARRSQLPAAPKKRKLRSHVEKDTTAQPLANDVSQSKENQSTPHSQSPKRTDHPVISHVGSSAAAVVDRAPSQSPARRRSHLETANITSSAPSRVPQMDSEGLANEAPGLRQHRMSHRHRSSLPLQKRYKYDVARSMEFAEESTRNHEEADRIIHSPEIQREVATSFGAITRSSAMTTRPFSEGPNRSSKVPAASPWNRASAPQVRLYLSNNADKGLASRPLLQASQTARAPGARDQSLSRRREEPFSQPASFSDVDMGISGSRILRAQQASKEAQGSQAIQPQIVQPKTQLHVNEQQSLNLGNVGMEHNHDFDALGEEGKSPLYATGRGVDDRAHFAKLTNSGSAPPTCYRGLMNSESTHVHRSTVVDPSALNLDSDMRYRGALPSSENNVEEAFFLKMNPYLQSGVNSTLIPAATLNVVRTKQTRGSNPTLGPQENFIGASNPSFVYPRGMERASGRTFTRHDSGEFANDSRDGRSWGEVNRNDATHADLTGNARKHVHMIPGANASSRDRRMDSNRGLVESVVQANSDSLPEIPVRSSAGGSCDEQAPMMMNSSKTAGERNISSRPEVMASSSAAAAGSVNRNDIENSETRTAGDLPRKSPVKQTNAASLNVKELQWEAKREALMAFAQGQRKNQTGNTQTGPRAQRRDRSQSVRHGSRNRNVPETERHRMEITALAASSSRLRYPSHNPKEVPTANKGSISNLLQSSSELPASGRIVNANSQINRGAFSQSFAGRTNYGPASSYDLHRLSEDGRDVDVRKRGGHKQKGVPTSQQRIYDDGPDNAYLPDSASFRGDDGRVSASRMPLPQQSTQMNTSYPQESPPTQMFDSLQGNRNVHQRPQGVDAFGSGELRFVQKPEVMASTSPRATHGSSGGYGMPNTVTSNSRRNGTVQGVALNSSDHPTNRSQGRSGQRLPSANNLSLPPAEECGSNRYQGFNNVPNHARLAPVSFHSNGLPSGSSQSGTPMPEPMEMPPFGRPGDPIRYHDLPPTAYGRAGNPVRVPPGRARGTQDVQRKNRVYMGRRVTNVEDVRQSLDRREVAPIREPFPQNDYIAPSNQGNEVRVKDCQNGFMNVRPSEERRTLANPPGSMARPRRLTTPYVQPETRRAQFEQGKALAFVGRCWTGHRAQRRQRISNVPNAPELPVAPLDYAAEGYHMRRSRIQGSSSLGKNEFLGNTTNSTPRLGALPDAGMSLSNQIRALVSQNTGKASKTPQQVDALQVADAPKKATQTPSDDQSIPQSDSVRQTSTSAAPVMAAPLVSEQLSKDSGVGLCVTQADAGAAASNVVEGT